MRGGSIGCDRALVRRCAAGCSPPTRGPTSPRGRPAAAPGADTAAGPALRRPRRSDRSQGSEGRQRRPASTRGPGSRRASRPTARSRSPRSGSPVSSVVPWLPSRAPLARPVAAGIAGQMLLKGEGAAARRRRVDERPAAARDDAADSRRVALPAGSRARAAAKCQRAVHARHRQRVRPRRRHRRARRASRARIRTAIRRRCSWPRPTTGASTWRSRRMRATSAARTPSSPGACRSIACDDRLSYRERRAILVALGREMDPTTPDGANGVDGDHRLREAVRRRNASSCGNAP